MSDSQSIAEIESHNVKCAPLFEEFWRRQGVDVRLTDPHKPIAPKEFRGGLPRAYKGDVAIKVKVSGQ